MLGRKRAGKVHEVIGSVSFLIFLQFFFNVHSRYLLNNRIVYGENGGKMKWWGKISNLWCFIKKFSRVGKNRITTSITNCGALYVFYISLWRFWMFVNNQPKKTSVHHRDIPSLSSLSPYFRDRAKIMQWMIENARRPQTFFQYSCTI